jgi:hypothetical protein
MTDYPTASYVTAAEAEAFWLLLPESVSTLWTDLDDSDIQLQYLIQASDVIDALPLRGERYEPEYIRDGLQVDINNDGQIQVLAFPRFIDGVIVDWDLGTGPNGQSGYAVVPKQVKAACCWEALALLQFASDTDNADREAMKNGGVQSYNMGGAYSETLGKSFFEKKHIRSLQALQLLRPYLELRPKVR